MSLEIVIGPPPRDIYEACDAKFKVRGRRFIIFTVGDKLYNPDNAVIEPWLWAHEEVHSKRQLASNVDDWWRAYLANKQFRFEEELVAHQEEWRVAKEVMSSRQQRRKQLGVITDRLSGGLYGHLVTREEAKRLIAGAAAV